MNKVPLTINGAERLRSELHQLKTVERPSVIAAIAEARSHGDLSENAEYDAAKERQAFVEGRIKEVEGKLSNEGFLAKAPEAVVEKEKAKKEDVKARLTALEDQLKELQKLQ